MDALVQLVIFFTLLTLGFVFGRRAEKKHYDSIFERERALRQIVVTADRLPPPEMMRYRSGLVSGSVVISVDYFKLVSASLRNLVGGNVSAYESLLDRARREALLRMQAQANAAGATAIINTKFETSRISGSTNGGVGSMEVLAYGTALVPPKPERET